MNDRPSAANGKRNASWGTLKTCIVCGRCLCYACHPRGPCADERTVAAQMHPPDIQAAGQAPTGHA